MASSRSPKIFLRTRTSSAAAFMSRFNDPPSHQQHLNADSGDCGHGFRLNATMRSDRRRPPVPTKAAGVSLPAFGVGSDFLGCVKFGALRSDLSHAVSIECEAVSVVDEPVEDGVSDSRIGDDVVPIFDRHLAGDDGRSTLVAIIDDFEEIAPLLAGERRETPIVKDEQIDPR